MPFLPDRLTSLACEQRGDGHAACSLDGCLCLCHEPPEVGVLSRRDRAMLDLHASAHGNIEATIRARFGVSPARHYQELFTLIDRQEARAHDPITVRRLLELRARRRADRGRPFGARTGRE